MVVAVGLAFVFRVFVDDKPAAGAQEYTGGVAKVIDQFRRVPASNPASSPTHKVQPPLIGEPRKDVNVPPAVGANVPVKGGVLFGEPAAPEPITLVAVELKLVLTNPRALAPRFLKSRVTLPEGL
jgi:hypothetical protein